MEYKYNNQKCEKEPPELIEFYFYKTDETSGEGVMGAEFLLEEYCGPMRKISISGWDGKVVFSVPAATRAFLREINPAPGYKCDEGVYRICMDPCKRLWINKCMVESFVLSAEKLPPEIF